MRKLTEKQERVWVAWSAALARGEQPTLAQLVAETGISASTISDARQKLTRLRRVREVAPNVYELIEAPPASERSADERMLDLLTLIHAELRALREATERAALIPSSVRPGGGYPAETPLRDGLHWQPYEIYCGQAA